MSEGDVSLIRDEDVLRRMWQQTEDFSRKKEIRTHMYKLREERLRNLYSPEPGIDTKGTEFTSQSHGESFADQSFQHLKRKEVRDAGSPTKDFMYHGQDLKALSNAGWNVESENKTTDNGHTHVRSVHANIEGQYDVDGGKGQFAAIDQHKQAVTEYKDDISSFKRNESSSNTAAHEQVVRNTDDGSHFTSKTSSSSSSSRVQQSSTTKYESVPYNTNENKLDQTNYNLESKKTTNTSDVEQILRNQNVAGEIISRKVEYPDDNTKVVVETRCLPDGTQVTSTRREFRGSAKQTKSSELHSQQIRNESKSYTSSTQQRSETKESSSAHQRMDNTRDIVESQKAVDDYDFRKSLNSSQQRDDRVEMKQFSTQQQTTEQIINNINDDSGQIKTSKQGNVDNKHTLLDTQRKQSEEFLQNKINKQHEKIDTYESENKTTSDQYHTTYQTDFTQRKVSTDWSPTQQAWASSLRSDTPTRTSTRSSSPLQSSTTSLRSSLSPDKSYRKPSSRGGSPSKFDRSSPSRISSDRFSKTHSTVSVSETSTSNIYTSKNSTTAMRSGGSPDRKTFNRRSNESPDKHPSEYTFKPSPSPERKSSQGAGPSEQQTKQRSRMSYDRDVSSKSKQDQASKTTYVEYIHARSPSPAKSKNLNTKPADKASEQEQGRSSISPEKTPGYMRPTASSKPTTSPSRSYISPDRKSSTKHITSQTQECSVNNKKTNIKEEHYKFIDEETKMYSPTHIKKERSSSPDKYTSPHETKSFSPKDTTDSPRCVSPTAITRPALRKASRSPSPPKGPVTFKDRSYDDEEKSSRQDIKKTVTEKTNNQNIITRKSTPSPNRDISPTKYGTYDKRQRRSEEMVETITTKKTDIKNVDTESTREKSPTKKDADTFISPTNKLRASASPAKSFIQENKHKQTSDFINMEKNNEQFTKTVTKERQRKLVTPSTSPTRKPKMDEQCPSTGQSSPTTSTVSDFVYFSSPHNENTTIVTDLDDDIEYKIQNSSSDHTADFKRPESLNIDKNSTPSKIPCRSPSPEKRMSPTKEVLPRKSSLKKPSTDKMLNSPVEKPPSTFRVSPSVETKDFSEHKVVKKDNPDKPTVDAPVKAKPPFERRETYEERCKKILGMMDDSVTETSLQTTVSNKKSPSVSPCRSPGPRESPLRQLNNKNATTDASDFLTDIKQHETNSSYRVVNKLQEPKSKSTSRESSPTKLKDITGITTSAKTETYENIQDETRTSKSITSHTKTVAPRSSISPTRKISSKSTDPKTVPLKDFISTEKEQEILEKVQNSLRKLSPARDQRSSSRERSPTKTTTSLQDLDIMSTETNQIKTDIIKEENEETIKSKSVLHKTNDEKVKKDSLSKPSIRNTSPIKKVTNTTKSSKVVTHELSVNSRSISPRKSIGTTERPQSPVSKGSGIKPRESIQNHLSRKPTSNLTKSDKTAVTDSKKSTVVQKQNSFTKTSLGKSTTNKVTQSVTTQKIDEENKFPIVKSTVKKDIDIKVSRTSSDVSIKTKKPSPTRVRSKPEIQVSDMTTKGVKATSTTTVKSHKPSTKQSQTKLSLKPKSATALNNTNEEDNIIIDVEQAKSSRENSPDRICPTPISYLDDISTPRLPDEVCEPDDEFRKRTHHVIHETETSVDDIVEISDDEELYANKTIDHVTKSDECLLSVNDKVSKFTQKIETMNNSKDAVKQFQDTEKFVHSDFDHDKLKSDECLLSVSEKVNKFAKGVQDEKTDQTPSRIITDDYDNTTIYQDAYTKLSVNDKAHLFVETAENIKSSKKPSSQKVQRPDLTNVDADLKNDDCLLSVSDKVNKFVKTAEQFLNEGLEIEEKDKKIKEQHDLIMKKITSGTSNTVDKDEEIITKEAVKTEKMSGYREEKRDSFSKETESSHAKNKNYVSPHLKSPEKQPPVKKITALRSSEAVKKAKALFENFSSTTQKTKDSSQTKVTKLTDIGVIKKSPKTDSTIVLHPSLDNGLADVDSDIDGPVKDHSSNNKHSRVESPKTSASPNFVACVPEVPSHSPVTKPADVASPTKSVLSRYPVRDRSESPKQPAHQTEKSVPQDNVPSYQRPTKTRQIKEDVKKGDEIEVSSRRGSGKFGVELKRTSIERSSMATERRRSSEHHQPCIEDIFDIDLLEQMLEKVVGYEQRRRIRAQIRLVKKKFETEQLIDNNTYTKSTKHTSFNTSRKTIESPFRSPERISKVTHKTYSPDRQPKSTPQKLSNDQAPLKDHGRITNGYAKESSIPIEHRTPSPDKHRKAPAKTKSPVRQPSPDKKARAMSPTKSMAAKAKPNKFNEYASAYMKKVGLKEDEKLKFSKLKTKKSLDVNKISEVKTIKADERKTVETICNSTSNSFSDRKSSKDEIEIVEVIGKPTSPERRFSPERKKSPVDRLYQRSPSPDFKRTKQDHAKKEAIIKTEYDIDKKTPSKVEDKPSWVTNRNLKKITSETRSFSSKKIEDKTKYRAASPSKVISRPLDVITSSYGPGPLDADGKPLFGIKALRNGSSNFQVKGTVIRQEFHSTNGSAPEGTVSVTAYSTKPEDLEKLLEAQGERPSRLHGLAAITTTKKFGGDTGVTIKEAYSKEESAAIEQFTHSDRRATDSYSSETNKTRIEDSKRGTKKADRKEQKIDMREERKAVRQSSVKSLTEKYIKSASDTSKSERSSYPKAGLILRTATMRDSGSSECSGHGLARTDSEHSLASIEDTTTTTMERVGNSQRTTTTRTHGQSKPGLTIRTQEKTVKTEGPVVRESRVVTQEMKGVRSQQIKGKEEISFLDNNTKVTGVQDILTRMKNADIVIEDGDNSEDAEARALLNKFLGATVLMAGMQNYVTEQSGGKVVVKQETVRRSDANNVQVSRKQDFDVDNCWDERLLRQLLEECGDYEQRRRLRARIRTIMAEQEACASAVTEALAAAGGGAEGAEGAESASREEEEVTRVTSSVRRNSSEKTVSTGVTTTTSKVVESVPRGAPKPVSPFTKFRQLEKQNSINSPKM